MIHKCAICGRLDYTRKIIVPQLESYIADMSNIFSREDMEYAPKVNWYGIKSSKKEICNKCIAKIVVAIYGLKAPEMREDPEVLAEYLEEIKWDILHLLGNGSHLSNEE